MKPKLFDMTLLVIFAVGLVLMFLFVGEKPTTTSEKPEVSTPNYLTEKDVANNPELASVPIIQEIFTAKDLTVNAKRMSENFADYRLKYIFTRNVYKVYEDEIGEKTALEREVFLESESGKSYIDRLKKTRNELLNNNYYFEFRTYDKINDYNIEDGTFTITLADKYGYKKTLADKNYIKSIHAIIFKGMPIYDRKEFGEYHYSSFKINVPKKDAIVIEKNRRHVKIQLFFRLSDEVEKGEYSTSVFSTPLNYTMPIVKAGLFRISLGDEILFQKVYQ